MGLEKIRHVVLAAGEVFRGRPWIGAVAFLALKAVSLISFNDVLKWMRESAYTTGECEC